MAKLRKPSEIPELSKLDKSLYVLLEILLGLVIPFAVCISLMRASELLASANPRMLAYSYTNAVLLSGALLLPLGIMGFAVFGALLDVKQPIFGRTDITYGYPYDASLYPIFRTDRQKHPPAAAALRRHRQLKKNAVRFLCMYLAVIAVSALGACPRYEMETDHTLVCYNSFNKPVRQYDMADYSAATVETRNNIQTRYWFNGYNQWTVYVTIGTSDGRTYRFADPHRCAKLVGFIRSLPPETVTVSGADRLPDVFDRYALTESEIDALRELFGLTE